MQKRSLKKSVSVILNIKPLNSFNSFQEIVLNNESSNPTVLSLDEVHYPMLEKYQIN